MHVCYRSGGHWSAVASLGLCDTPSRCTAADDAAVGCCHPWYLPFSFPLSSLRVSACCSLCAALVCCVAHAACNRQLTMRAVLQCAPPMGLAVVSLSAASHVCLLSVFAKCCFETSRIIALYCSLCDSFLSVTPVQQGRFLLLLWMHVHMVACHEVVGASVAQARC